MAQPTIDDSEVGCAAAGSRSHDGCILNTRTWLTIPIRQRHRTKHLTVSKADDYRFYFSEHLKALARIFATPTGLFVAAKR
jgi:hypothetical protein